MSKNRHRSPKKGRGYAPKTSKTQENKISAGSLVYVLVLMVLVIAVGVYWFTRGREASNPGQEITTASGLKYIDEVVGTGPSPSPGKMVSVHYTGTLQNGTKFDSSVDRGQPYEFPLGVGQVIRGWDEGILTMKVGGKRRLIIPPELGYGSRGNGKIPPNSTLLFEVELLNVR